MTSTLKARQLYTYFSIVRVATPSMELNPKILHLKQQVLQREYQTFLYTFDHICARLLKR